MKHLDYNVLAFGDLMINRMGFQQFERASGEVFWQKNIPGTQLAIQVRSGMRSDGSFLPAPDLGIRIHLISLTTFANVMPVVRVRRTQHSLRNVRERVGALWKHAIID